MKKVLVTGVAGFIGTNFYLEWQKRFPEDELFGIDNFATSNVLNLQDYKGIFLLEDIRNFEWSHWITDLQPDVIFHFAGNAVTTDYDSQSQVSVNLEGFKNLLAAASKRQIPIIWTSSAAVYGQKDGVCHETDILAPNSPYAVSKYLAENVVNTLTKKSSWKIITIRPFNIYGPHIQCKNKMACYVNQMVEQAILHKEIELFSDGEQQRDFLHVSDLVDLMICADQNLSSSATINGGSGQAISFNAVRDIIEKELQINIKTFYKDKFFIPSHFQSFTQAGTTQQQKLLTWVPRVDIVTGIRELITQYKKHWKIS